MSRQQLSPSTSVSSYLTRYLMRDLHFSNWNNCAFTRFLADYGLPSERGGAHSHVAGLQSRALPPPVRMGLSHSHRLPALPDVGVRRAGSLTRRRSFLSRAGGSSSTTRAPSPTSARSHPRPRTAQHRGGPAPALAAAPQPPVSGAGTVAHEAIIRRAGGWAERGRARRVGGLG